jgi:glucose-6-phosphate 1-dehydrogenase
MPSTIPADTLVLFGITGDLAGKMLLPALAQLALRESLDLPVVGVVRGDATVATVLEASQRRIRDGGADLASGFETLARRLVLVRGDLADAPTYARIADALRGARHPLYYLAIPPQLFAPVVQGLAAGGLARGARVAIEKPFGHDLESSRALERVVTQAFDDDAVLHIDHFLGKDPLRNLADMRATTAWLEPLWSQAHVRGIQVTMAEAFGIGTRGAFYDRVGVLRDVFQNHLLELVALLTMEPAAPADVDAYSAARVEALRAIAPLDPADVVYGQYDGYRSEPHVDPRSQVATFMAARLHVDTPRFAGVPIHVRAGKRLPLTATVASIALSRARPVRSDDPSAPCDHLRFRLGPGKVSITLDTHRLDRGSTTAHLPLALVADLPDDRDRDAYVNLLRAALAGDVSVSERAAGVCAAWRAVDAVLRADIAVEPYREGSWGPASAARLLAPGQRWFDPPGA